MIIESKGDNEKEIERATESFMKILDVNNAKARIAYHGSKKQVISEIDILLETKKSHSQAP
jgi:hypothetical protein